MVIGIDASRAFVAEPTGTENYSRHLITHMLQLPAAKSHFFVLFTRPNAIVPPEIAGYSNCLVKEIKYRYLWTQVGLARETWKRFKIQDSRFKLDVLWIPAHTLPVLRNHKVKTVVTIHGLEYRWLPEYHNALQRWYLPLSTFYAAKAADRIICVSQATQRDLANEVDFDIEKSIVIYEGTEANESLKHYTNAQVQDTLSKFGIQKKKYILFVGTVQPRKNLKALIVAFAEFYTKHPDWKLVIAGAVGWRAEPDLAAPEVLGIPEAVIFTGRVSQAILQTLYLGAGMYVQPSWTEGFGLPVLEAMASGVPTIVSDGGALPEVVGEAGVIVKLLPKFEKRLAEAMGRVEDDEKLQNKLKAMGLKRVGEFGWQKAAKATLGVLVGE